MSATAIFESIEQALHFSFLMETLPAAQKSQMQVLFDLWLERNGYREVREPSTINFGGLSALEIRGQCSMVRGAVLHQLDEPGISVIHARYAYGFDKGLGIKGARKYCAPMMSTQDEWPTLAMAVNVFGSAKQSAEFSIRNIAKQWGLSKSTVARDVGVIRTTSKMLEQRAYDRLRPIFEKSDLIGAE
jgi:hypothetical protein